MRHEHLSKKTAILYPGIPNNQGSLTEETVSLIEVPLSSKQSRKLLKDVERPELAFS